MSVEGLEVAISGSEIGAASERQLPAFFYRLSLRDQQRYLRSDSIDRFELAPSSEIASISQALVAALEADARDRIAEMTQAMLSELCRMAAVPVATVEVRGVRPHDRRRELHGIFYPRMRPPKIVLWMRTARRHDVVRAKTFIRTLAHEFGHYLDYAQLKLGDSYHCRGFFRRESFLVRILYPGGI